MKKTIKLLFVTSILLLVFSGSRCNKGKDDCFDCTTGPKDTLYIEKDFLDYWYAETGSWWVFKRTDTVGVDIYDTMRVVYHKSEIKFNNIINGRSAFEKVDIYITHSYHIFKNPNFENSIVGRYDASINAYIYTGLSSIEYSWVFDKQKVFYLPFNQHGSMLSLSFPFLLHTVETRLLPYKVEDILAVIETPYKKLGATLIVAEEEGLNVRFYISKNIGISRMEIQGGQIWELIDCNIIRTQ